MAYVNIIVDICHFGCYAWHKGCQKTGRQHEWSAGGGTYAETKKCRKVCQMPAMQEFHPVGSARRRAAVILSVDEYEAIRLIDKQGFSQEECGRYMQVAPADAGHAKRKGRKGYADRGCPGREQRGCVHRGSSLPAKSPLTHWPPRRLFCKKHHDKKGELL